MRKLGLAFLGLLLLVLWLVRGRLVVDRGVGEAPAPDGGPTRAASALEVPEPSAGSGALQQFPSPVPAVAPDELRGRVVATSGAPVAGACVRAEVPLARQWPGPHDERPEPPRVVGEARTDDRGRFALRGLEARGIDLWIEAEGFACERRPWVLAESELVVVLARPARLVGRLAREPEGAPASGVTVEVQRGPLPNDFLTSAEITSDAEGRFTFEALAPGYYTLAAEGHVLGGVLLAEGRSESFEARLARRTFVEGRVEDARDGQAIAGARVWPGIERAAAVVADGDGEFRLDGLPLGRALTLVRASAPGFGDGQASELSKLDESGARVVVRLLPGRRCTGRIVEAGGEPLASAYVTAAAVGSDRSRDERSARSGPDGRFELADLRADLRHTLIVRAEGHASAVFDFPARELGLDALELGDLALEPPALLAGVVVDRAGHPLVRHLVVARGEPAARDRLDPAESGEGYLAGFGSRDSEMLTDDLGRFAFADLPAGAWTLVADRKGWWNESELAVTLASGERRAGLTLVVDEGLALEGVVLDEEERALAGATVELFAAGEAARALYVFADERGRFAFHGLPPGDHSVAARGGFGSEDEFVEARHAGIRAGTTDERLVLERSVAQRVRVVDRQGDPLPGAFVGLVDAGGESGRLDPCDDHGLFTLRVSARATFALRAYANRHFDPDADFFDAFFLDEQGILVPEMSAERTGLTASDEVIELVIPGLP